MKLFTKVVLGLTVVGVTSVVIANTVVNQQAIQQPQAVNQQAFYKMVTVKQALMLADDTRVQLKGYVVKAIGDEKYEFRDATGSITVDIDNELWGGREISEKTPITIIGEVDVDYKPMKHVEIDVDTVKF